MQDEAGFQSAAGQKGGGEVSVLDLAITLAQYKTWCIGFPLAAAILAAGISLLLADVYTATARIMPPQQAQNTAASLLGQLGALAGVSSSAKSPAELHVGMLKSRTVADNLVSRFGLQKYYKVKFVSDARGSLEQASRIAISKEGLVVVEVEDKDPKMAADLANGYVDELMKVTSVLAVTEAGQRRLFFEKQLENARNNLRKAEVAAGRAIETGGMEAIDAKGRAIIATVAQLRAQISAKEVELSAVQGFAGTANPELERVRRELSALRQQLAKLEGGPGGASPGQSGQAGDGAGLDSMALLRDVKYHEVLFELLMRQYEAARLDEAKEGAVVQILDVATVPERKTYPRRSRIVVFTALAAGLFAVMAAFTYESWSRNAGNDSHRERLRRLRRELSWRRRDPST